MSIDIYTFNILIVYKTKIEFSFFFGFLKTKIRIIENGCVTKGIVYGINSCGKSNLGLAIFDIITHLTEKEKLLRSYDLYLNMSGRKSFAEFEYVFTFDGH